MQQWETKRPDMWPARKLGGAEKDPGGLMNAHCRNWNESVWFNKRNTSSNRSEIILIQKRKHLSKHHLRRRKRKKRDKKKRGDMSEWRLPEFTPAGCAKLALEIEQKTYSEPISSHVFVESLGCTRFLAYIPEGGPHSLVDVPVDKLRVGDYCHVSFMAKPRKTTTDHDHQVLIFAELIDRGLNEFQVSDFWISERNSPRLQNGCAFCPREDRYPHPMLGGAIGQYEFDHKQSIATSQSELAESFKNYVLSRRNNTFKFESNVILNYTLPDPSNFSPELLDDEYAMIALSTINKKEASKFELVKTLGYRRQKWSVDNYRDWCHMCFIAKPQNADAAQVYFFAELSNPGVRKFSVMTYARVDPNAAETTRGCGICPEKFLHPAAGSFTLHNFPPKDSGGLSDSDDYSDFN
ncbi:hypothetical protein M5689_019593 [Euphorbia peplus]|nr:hypothetical protein M5689_019593 [Euphorbia peplus]